VIAVATMAAQTTAAAAAALYLSFAGVPATMGVATTPDTANRTTRAAPATPSATPSSAVSAGRSTPAAADLTVSRVDVSGQPRIGAVVTVDGTLTAAQVRAGLGVSVNGVTYRPIVRPLSGKDVELVVVADAAGQPSTSPGAAPTLLTAEQNALTRLVQDLPGEARIGVLDQSGDVTGLGSILSSDPLQAVRAISALDGRTPSASPAERLESALAVFSAGATTRRTLVLVTADGRHESPAILDHLARRLAASGTQLFVLDATPGHAADVSALADATGGFAAQLSNRVDADILAASTGKVARALAQQYYVRFTNPSGLPQQVTVRLRSGSVLQERVLQLPMANPLPPAAAWTAAPAPAAAGSHGGVGHDLPLVILSVLLVVSSLAYSGAMLVSSRRAPRSSFASTAGIASSLASDLFFVFVLPCLNEERVIRATVERLLSMPGGNFAVLVVDDDSDDGTAQIVSSFLDHRVWLLRRRAPQARHGKGEALNAAVRQLEHSDVLAGRDRDRVVLVVVDADGRLDRHVFGQVAPLFADPQVGGVQTGVRINNRRVSLLARMQDMEFFIYTQVFQRGRRHLGSVGLGGNGQFMRMSALLSLGSSPWSRSLTEDLDLGVRLLANGWRNEFCHTADVHQQGLVHLTRLVRQRTRWFQGHLQAWRLIPMILRGAPAKARADLVYHVSSPFLLLVASLLTASFLVSSADAVVHVARGQNPITWWALSTYLLAFGPSAVFTYLYWRDERHNGLRRLTAVLYAHLYVVYGLMWYVAGWRALWRMMLRRSGWTKTERMLEPLVIDVTDSAVGPATGSVGSPGVTAGVTSVRAVR